VLQEGPKKVVELILVNNKLSKIELFGLIIESIVLGLINAQLLMIRGVLFVFQVGELHGTQFHDLLYDNK